MGVQRVRQALIALKPVDRERFGGYARYCLKFQREDLTAEVCPNPNSRRDFGVVY